MRNMALACAIAAVFIASSPTTVHAHGTWVAKRFNTLTIVLGEGSDDENYDVAKVKNVLGYTAEHAPANVAVENKDGYVTVHPAAGTAMLAIEFDHGYWSKGQDGKSVNKPMPEVAGATAGTRALKYNVTYLDPAIEPRAIAELPIQIIPAINPARLKQGDPLEVQVMYQGKPLAGTDVIVDVIGDLDNTIKTDADGKATIPVRNMGLNVIGVETGFPLENNELATKTVYFTSISFVAAQ